MKSFERVHFTPRGSVGVSKNGITVPSKYVPLFPDFSCNLLRSGNMFALEPRKDGDLRIRVPKCDGTGRIGRRDVTKLVMSVLNVSQGEKANFDTWVDDGCLIFAREQGAVQGGGGDD